MKSCKGSGGALQDVVYSCTGCSPSNLSAKVWAHGPHHPDHKFRAQPFCLGAGSGGEEPARVCRCSASPAFPWCTRGDIAGASQRGEFLPIDKQPRCPLWGGKELIFVWNPAGRKMILCSAGYSEVTRIEIRSYFLSWWYFDPSNKHKGSFGLV